MEMVNKEIIWKFRWDFTKAAVGRAVRFLGGPLREIAL